MPPPVGQPCSPGVGGQIQTGVKGLSAVGYQGPRIIYKVKIENPGPEPICDVRVVIFHPKDMFLVDAPQKEIALLKPMESNTVTFYIRPTGECGKRTISGEADFYDYGSACRKKINITPRDVEVVCPIMSPMDIPDTEWNPLKQRLISSQDETKEIPIGADALSQIIFGAIKEFNMTPLKQTRVMDGAYVHIIGRFAGKGVKGLEYAARVEVVGGPRESRVLLTCYTQTDAALTGFHHSLVDMIEKRTQVKRYLTDNIIIQNIKGDYIAGDKISIKDSVIQRSTIK